MRCKTNNRKESWSTPEKKAQRKEVLKTYREKLKADPKRWAKETEYAKVRRAKNPEQIRYNVWKSKLKINYGLTPENYETMLKEQNNRCKICSETFTSTAHVDHCHTTGKVRGLLCGNCNHGLGKFKDNTKLLQNAITYLLETRDYL